MNFRYSTTNILLVIVLIIGAMLRLYNYNGWSLSNDELSALARLRFENFSMVLESGVMLNDMHPPGVQSLLYVLTTLFGNSETVVRLPFVLMGILSIYIFFLIGTKWFNRNSSLFATTAFSFLQFPILYSQLARPYSPGLLFSLLAVYYWTRIIQQPKDSNAGTRFNKNYVGFILSCVACMYTHYFSFMFVGIVGLCGLFIIPRTQLKWYLISSIIIFVLYLPSIKIFLYHFSIGGLGGEGGWLGPPSQDALLKYLRYCFNDSNVLLFVFIMILSLSIVTRKGLIPFTRYHALCLLFCLAPALIAFLYSLYKNPVFQYSILLFSFPYILLFVFSYIKNFEWNPLYIAAWVILLSAGIYSTVVTEKFYSTQHFGVFKELAEKTVEYDNQYGVSNITHTVNVISPFYIDYYSVKINQQSKFAQYKSVQPTEWRELDSIVQNSNTPYFLHGWSNTYHGPEVIHIITEKYPIIIDKNIYFNSGITLFGVESLKPFGEYIEPAMEFDDGFEKPEDEKYSQFLTQNKVRSGIYAAHLSKDQEYGPTFQSTLKDINCKKHYTIQLSIWVNSSQIPLDANLVLSIDDKDKNIVWRGANCKQYLTKSNTWQKVYLDYRVMEEVTGNEIIKIYMWNSGKTDFYFDDLNVKIIP